MPNTTPQPTKRNITQAVLYAILDTSFVAPENLETTALALIAGGADIVQLRAKNVNITTYAQYLERLIPTFQNTNIPLIVNDHLEIAERFPQVGLHIGQDDIHPLAARERLCQHQLLGYSTHSIEQAISANALAGTLDYFAVGPVFATNTKPEYSAVGLELVRRVADLPLTLPFFCIGGIKLDRIPDVRKAGGNRVVVISELLQSDNIELATRRLKSSLC